MKPSEPPGLSGIWRVFAVSLLATGLIAPALADERPACSAGGRESLVSTQDQLYWVEQVAEGLNFPTSMAWLPNGDMLISERTGDLRILRNSQLDPQPLKGTPATFKGSSLDGLKEILLDPDYGANQTIYLSLAEGTFQERHAAVYRARYSPAGLRDVERIFRSKDERGGPGSVAGRMMFLADKTLLVAVAEDHKERAQKLNSHFGKILRIHRDGSTPKDNPLVNTPGALPEIWSYGHRVPLGLYLERDTGVIWEVESGPRGGDELNRLEAGANYGWAKTSWGFAYGNEGLDAPLQSAAGIKDPVLVWTPSVTPSGLTRYRGNVYPQWDGDYFLGHLTTKEIERLRIDGDRVVVQERMLLDLEERIRDVKVGPDQYLYLLTSHPNGRVLRLHPGRPNAKQFGRIARKLAPTQFPEAREAELVVVKPGDLVRGEQAFLERCAACHRVGTTVEGGQIGPDLAGVYGRLMGRQADFDYSPNMAGSSWPWYPWLLDKFLADPSGAVPGTKMAAPPVSDPQVRGDIIEFLKQQSEKLQ